MEMRALRLIPHCICISFFWTPIVWGGFSMVVEDQAVSIVMGETDAPPVQRAASDLCHDIQRVTGFEPELLNQLATATEPVIIVGQIGCGGVVDQLVDAGVIDVSSLRGKWEGYHIQEVTNVSVLGALKQALVVVGSDMRGTIYGIYELSRLIGVSPWYWWADVPVQHNPAVSISAEEPITGAPSVKYRGIFINDEDWGLQPWAALTYDPELGDLGPKTYERVFELLLRLKANALWPAMHKVTRAFNADGQNAKLAAAYGIVMGSSHAEPMLRNNVREWVLPKNYFNFSTHPDEVLEYWDQRVAANKEYENLYTLGMRGIHDSGMTAGESVEEKVAFLDNIIRKQREILGSHIERDLKEIPQVFTPYKEVLELYQNGLEVPDEVTLAWPDDNHGYIRHFATAEEQKRSGGSGIYYHLSYLGAPLSYIWLQSTPPGVIWQQMHQAWAYGARDLWIVNVGDIKPAEIGMEFFLSLAWDIDQWQPETVNHFLVDWAAREFGVTHADTIASIMEDYFELNFQRRPEHLQWWLPHRKERSSALTQQEREERLSAFASLTLRAESIGSQLPSVFQDAFFQLVHYPVAASDAANQRVFYSELYRDFFHENTPLRQQYGLKVRLADQELRALTHRYNHDIADGKWRNMIAVEPADNNWRSYRTADVILPAENLVASTLDESLFREDDHGELLRTQDDEGAGFTEHEGVVAMEAENFTSQRTPKTATWRRIAGAGRSGDAVAIYPETTASLEIGNADAAFLEYDFVLKSEGELQITAWLLPTFPIDDSHGIRIAIGLDDRAPVLIEINRKVKDKDWSQAVLNATISASQSLGHVEPGSHTLRLYQVDPGVVVDKLALHFDELPSSYLGPKETRAE